MPTCRPNVIILGILVGCVGPGKSSPEPGGASPFDLLEYVNPFIGTGGVGFGVGSNYPGAQWPFGLVRVSPDTSLKDGTRVPFYHCGGYHYDDDHIEAFSHLHLQGIGVPAHGIIGLVPADGWTSAAAFADNHRLKFSHEDESASPGRYTVTLHEPAVTVDLTASPKTALHRYAFEPGVTAPTVILDLGHTLPGGTILDSDLTVDPDTGEIIGYVRSDGDLGGAFDAWFRMAFDATPVAYGLWAAGDDVTGDAISGTDIGAWFTFEQPTVHTRVRVSMVGPPDGLEDEARLSAFAFEDSLAAVEDAWTDRLAAFRFWGGTERDRTIVATAVYHVLQMPTDVTEGDQYTGFDETVHTATGFRYYTDFSLWDTYRTTHPLYTLAWPNTHRDMLQSLVRMVEQGGRLPRWPLANSDSGSMIGQPAGIVLGEAAAKGLLVTGEGIETAVAQAVGTHETPGRPHQAEYLAHGYYPSDIMGGSVSWSQEIAIADHAMSGLALAIGDEDAAETLAERSRWWRNLYDADAEWFHGRLSDGQFESPPTPDRWEDEYVEGNARQYLWLAPHDPEGLFEVLGGKDRALERLDEMMEQGRSEFESPSRVEALPGTWYWHGNEPGLHIPWLFALAGQPADTRHWVDWALDTQYGVGSDGLAGNDDGGTLSAWAVFAAMGVYPLAGTDRYVLGRPRFERIEIHPDDGSEPLVITRGTGHGVRLDDVAWDAPDFLHADWMNGRTLAFGN